MRKDAKVELLRRAPLFDGCSKRQLADIARITDEIELADGATLTREGRPPGQFYVLVDGRVAVSKRGRKIRIKGGSEFFGEIGLLTRAPANATVVTTAPSRALVITGHDFRALLSQSPAIQLRILRSLAERMAPDLL